MWFATEQPKMDLFLKPFVESMLELQKNGVQWRGGTKGTDTVEVYLHALCCDAPAKAKVLNVTQWNGFYGCPYCLQKGETPENFNTLVYPYQENVEVRNNKLIREQMKQVAQLEDSKKTACGVKGPSALTPLQFDLVNGVTIDYMHAVLLGVVRFLVKLWFDDVNKSEKYYINSEGQTAFDERIAQIKFPKYIAKPIRSMKNRDKFKAHEWRAFLLFYSVPALKDLLPRRFLKHYITLVSAIFILLKDDISHEEITEANNLLTDFVKNFQILYGIHNMRFNVHLLLHLGKCVSRCGPLWAYSAFPFEGGNRELLSFLNGTRYVLQQMADKFLLCKKNESLLKEDIVSDAAREFCNDVRFYKRNKKSFKEKNNATVLNNYQIKLNDMEKKILNQNGINRIDEIKGWRTLIVQGTIFHDNAYTRSEKSMDATFTKENSSFVIKKILTYDNRIFIIATSILPLSKKNELLPKHVQQCAIDNDLQLFSSNQISGKSILMNFDDNQFLTKPPNSWESD